MQFWIGAHLQKTREQQAPVLLVISYLSFVFPTPFSQWSMVLLVKSRERGDRRPRVIL